MRFSHIVLAYFVMGAVMWGGGAIVWDDAGLAQLFVEDPETDTTINEETSSQLGNLGGPIQQAAGSIGGSGLIAVWNVLVGLIAFLFWPISVLLGLGAPAEAVVLFGGTPTVAFYGTLIRIVRSSA